MKKWLIIAAVVAMFAMVFPACGKDEGGNGDASPPELTFVYNTEGGVIGTGATALQALIVTWTGAAGYDYEVYFEQRDFNGVITPLDINPATPAIPSGVKGQTLYPVKMKIGSDKKPADPYWEIGEPDGAEKTLWSIAIGASSSGTLDHHYYGNTSSTTNTALDSLFSTLTTGTGKINQALPGNATVVPRTVHFRVGIVAAHPGGFPIAEKRTIVYSEWF